VQVPAQHVLRDRESLLDALSGAKWEGAGEPRICAFAHVPLQHPRATGATGLESATSDVGDEWTSNWDMPGNRWFCSFLHRDRNAWGTVAFIDNTGYNWWYTEYSHGDYTGSCSAGRYIDFTKVCLCKNSDAYSIYWGRCVGRRNGTWQMQGGY